MARVRPGWLLLAALLLAGCTPPPSGLDTGPRPGLGAARAGTASTAWLTKTQLDWQVQLTGVLDLTVPAHVYELDAFSTAAADVARLHAAGRKVICHVNAGVSEDFRPDAARFPASVQGATTGRPGERWLDIRRWDVLKPILSDRFTMCRDKGFDAVEADHVDGYLNPTGFALTSGDQLTFNRQVAALAHARRLAIALKNDLDQVTALEPDFDFAINEECFRHADCTALEPFLTAGKAVFQVEYDLPVESFCPAARAYGFASMRKRSSLDAWRDPC